MTFVYEAKHLAGMANEKAVRQLAEPLAAHLGSKWCVMCF